jgi:ABC-type uncharacterized transport system involved in gliding motility auxiliary subunit
MRHLEQGGNLLWLLDPGDTATPDPLPGFLGITVPPGIIIDVAGQLIGINDPTVAMITSSLYGQHPVLEGFSFTTLFPQAAAVQATAANGWAVTPLLSTGNHTWLETGLVDENTRFDTGVDLQGPLILGVGLEREVAAGNVARQQRIIVVGDGDFLSNTYLDNSGNLDLGIRIVNWLSDDQEMIEIPARVVTDTQLTVSPVTIGIAGLLFLVGMPLLLLGSGLVIWWRRRKA